MKKNTSLMAKFVVIMAIMYFGVFSAGVFTENHYRMEVRGAEFELGDVVSYFDAEARNVTYAIAPSTSSLALSKIDTDQQIFSLNRVLVRSSTVPYSIFGNDDSQDVPIFHSAQPEFLQAYYQLAHFTGEYRLNKIAELFNYKEILGSHPISSKISNLAELQGLVGLVEEANDTTIAEGYTARGTEKIAVEDLRGSDYDLNINLSDSSVSIFQGSLEPEYQKYAESFSGNTSETDFVKASEVDDKKNSNIVVSGFDNLEEDGFLTTLKSNLAQNHTTASDPVTPDRITILDYTVYSANLTNYISSDFQSRIREAIDEDAEGASVQPVINIFGIIKIYGPITQVSARLIDDVPSVTRVYTQGRVVTSTPLPRKTSEPAKLEPFVESFTPKVSTNIGSGVVKSALTDNTKITKDGNDFASAFALAMMAGSLSKLDSSGTKVNQVADSKNKFIDDALNTINTNLRKIIDWVSENWMWLALFGGAGIIIALIIYMKYYKSPGAEKPLRPY